MYREKTEDLHYDELEEKFVECMRNNAVAKQGYEAARHCAMNEVQRLKAAIVLLCGFNGKLKDTVEVYLNELPAFRAKPIGSPNSYARASQEVHVELEDKAKDLLRQID